MFDAILSSLGTILVVGYEILTPALASVVLGVTLFVMFLFGDG